MKGAPDAKVRKEHRKQKRGGIYVGHRPCFNPLVPPADSALGQQSSPAQGLSGVEEAPPSAPSRQVGRLRAASSLMTVVYHLGPNYVLF